MQTQPLLSLLAAQARTRANRQATTLPLFANMGGAALAAELRLLAEDSEALLRAAGLPAVTPLRPLAERIPALVGRLAAQTVAASNIWAGALERAARCCDSNQDGDDDA